MMTEKFKWSELASKRNMITTVLTLIAGVLGYSSQSIQLRSLWQPDIDAAIEEYHNKNIVPLLQSVEDLNKGIMRDKPNEIKESPSDRSPSTLRQYN
jgi:hypothetical protein